MSQPKTKTLEVVSLVNGKVASFAVKTDGFQAQSNDLVTFIDQEGNEHSIWTHGNVLYHLSTVTAF